MGDESGHGQVDQLRLDVGLGEPAAAATRPRPANPMQRRACSTSRSVLVACGGPGQVMRRARGIGWWRRRRWPRHGRRRARGAGDDPAVPHADRGLGRVAGVRQADGRGGQAAVVEDQVQARPPVGGEHAPEAPGEVADPEPHEPPGLGWVFRQDDHGDPVAGAGATDGFLGRGQPAGPQERDHAVLVEAGPATGEPIGQLRRQDPRVVARLRRGDIGQVRRVPGVGEVEPGQVLARAGHVEGIADPGRHLGQVARAVQQRQHQLGQPHPARLPRGPPDSSARASSRASSPVTCASAVRAGSSSTTPASDRSCR